MSPPALPPRPSPPPSLALRARLDALAEELGRTGDASHARALRALTDAWWAEEEAWLAQIVEVLRLHHDINNALVGVRGNAQLLLMAPLAEQPGVRERLEVVLRESTRIKDAALRILDLKSSIVGQGPATRAA